MSHESPAASRSLFAREPVQTLAVAALLVAVLGLATWPQFQDLSTTVADHFDPLLSTWRLGWIAHALATHPGGLFDAPIFYPEVRTFAYTDAVLLQGVVATPFIWLGVPLVLVYNVVLFGSMVLSGVGAWLLARRLTGHGFAALIAALAFTCAPFRFDHFEHLELQASFCLPWMLLALENVYARGRWRDALIAAAVFVAQVLSSIYYAVFLATLLPLYVLARFPLRGLLTHARTGFLRTLAMLAVAGLLLVPYLSVYSRNHDTVGERPISELDRYSAAPADFLHVNPEHLLLGRALGEDTFSERRLFPGIVVSVLALAALVAAPGRKTTAFGVLAVAAALIALGNHTPLFPWLREHVLPYRGLRVPARAMIIGQLALSLLAAFAVARLPRAGVRAAVIAGLLAAGVVLDGVHLPVPLRRPTKEPVQLARWLAGQPDAVVLELPLPSPKWFYLADGDYMFAAAATGRWNRTVNGYSGFYPRSYLELLDEMQTFPDDRSIAYLRARRVDLVIVHQDLYKTAEYGPLLTEILERRDLAPAARIGGAGHEVVVFRVTPPQPPATAAAAPR